MAIHSQAPASPLQREVRLLLQAAMTVFTFTVVVGILNGTDLVDFDRKTVLTHVHVGTLGWITMSVFAASLWLFGQGKPVGSRMLLCARGLTVLAVVALPLYSFTFAFTYGSARPTLGGLVLAIIIGFFAWVLLRASQVELTVPHWGFFAAVATSAVGGLLGVLLGIKIATGNNVLPSGGADAHPATMVVGFLIPVGMALCEWCLAWPRPERAGRLGIAQIVLPFIGGLLLMVSLLLDIIPLAPIAALIELGGVGIFLKRLWPRLRTVQLREGSIGRFAAATATAIVFNILLINYLAAKFQGDFDKVPRHQILALDHTMFVGVLTNAIFGLLLASAGERPMRWARADHAVFFGINVGLIGFVVGLLFDVVLLKRMFTPVMGASILLGLGLATYRLWVQRAERAGSEVAAAAPAGGS
jgi:hypothetical protein